MPVQELHSSSAIERIAYNPASRDLSVWFRSGRRYVYADVPPQIYRALCDSDSAGTFINKSVKGYFHCCEVPPRRRYYD
ncbi:KTSC domain-containing protein [Tsuneonella sp. HG249]